MIGRALNARYAPLGTNVKLLHKDGANWLQKQGDHYLAAGLADGWLMLAGGCRIGSSCCS